MKRVNFYDHSNQYNNPIWKTLIQLISSIWLLHIRADGINANESCDWLIVAMATIQTVIHNACATCVQWCMRWNLNCLEPSSVQFINIWCMYAEKFCLGLSSICEYESYLLSITDISAKNWQVNFICGNVLVLRLTQIYISIWRYHAIIRLTHCSLVTPYGNKDLGQHWPR